MYPLGLDFPLTRIHKSSLNPFWAAVAYRSSGADPAGVARAPFTPPADLHKNISVCCNFLPPSIPLTKLKKTRITIGAS